MPSSPPKACKRPYCPALVTDGTYYCDEHKAAPRQDRRTLSSTERGYDGTWRKFRAWFLLRHPLCEDCKFTRATDVHHVKKLKDYPELRLVESNCMALCGTCHKARTAAGQ